MFSALRSATRSVGKAALAQQQRGFKCSVLGAAGGIGQPLSLLLKINPRVTALTCFDVAPITPGVAADLSHIATNSSCTGFTGDELTKALDGCDVVVIPAGVPRKPGMTRDDLFNINAGIVKNLVAGCAEACPNAAILIISNPVNSTVPIAAEVLKSKGVYNPKKLFGVTTLDVCRAQTFVGGAKGNDPSKVKVPVIGGHAGTTIVPLLSQAEPTVSFSDEERDALTHRIMFGGDEVVKAKAGGGSATLSMAFTGAQFADRVMAGLAGEKGVTECTFVETDMIPGCKFFSLPVTLGKEGVETIHAYGKVNDYEAKLIADMTPDLIAQAEKGIAWAAEHK
uniref:Malate dehydrogenase n=1 Tax=Strombidinopsis acuminata TaxID=141414 RepID=A0A7S3WW17_9SPIT|mmetsp:Transcript_61988/g.85510  ORF Transcript_61988/g.85510 Transcript_61988/m.85510 type:complete len:339 (+) Transcript_61988:63-1079(+)